MLECTKYEANGKASKVQLPDPMAHFDRYEVRVPMPRDPKKPGLNPRFVFENHQLPKLLLLQNAYKKLNAGEIIEQAMQWGRSHPDMDPSIKGLSFFKNSPEGDRIVCTVEASKWDDACLEIVIDLESSERVKNLIEAKAHPLLFINTPSEKARAAWKAAHSVNNVAPSAAAPGGPAF